MDTVVERAVAAVLEKVRPSTELHVHFEELTYIDHACLDLLLNWEKQHEATSGSLVIDWESLTAKFHQPGNGKNNGPGTAAKADKRSNGSVQAPASTRAETSG